MWYHDAKQECPNAEPMGMEPVMGAEALRAFVAEHRQLLSDPRCEIGTWYDADKSGTWLDISVTLSGRTQAVCLGKRYNQEGVFDLGRMEKIRLEGTGTSPAHMPPVAHRLPKLRTGPAPPRHSLQWPRELARA